MRDWQDLCTFASREAVLAAVASSSHRMDLYACQDCDRLHVVVRTPMLTRFNPKTVLPADVTWEQPVEHWRSDGVPACPGCGASMVRRRPGE